MVTYFTHNDLISFGTYLLSEKRIKSIQDSYAASNKIRLAIGMTPAPFKKIVEEIVEEIVLAAAMNWVCDLEDSNKPTSEGHNSKNAGEDNKSEGTNSK